MHGDCGEKAVEKKLAQKDYMPKIKKVRFAKKDIFILKENSKKKPKKKSSK